MHHNILFLLAFLDLPNSRPPFSPLFFLRRGGHLCAAVTLSSEAARLAPPGFLGIAMLSNFGDIVMRILSKRQLKELVLYSPQHIARPEKAAEFSKRVQLGPNKVGWVEDEGLDWLQQRLESRETT